jgi:hypothetical protein
VYIEGLRLRLARRGAVRAEHEDVVMAGAPTA